MSDETTPTMAEGQVTQHFRDALNALVDTMEEELAEMSQEFDRLHADVARLEKKVEQLKMALYNPAGYRNQTAPMECPVCGQEAIDEEPQPYGG